MQEKSFSAPRTDAGNAELFVKLFRDKARYDHTNKSWLIWRKHWWERDVKNRVYQYAISVARYRKKMAAHLDSERAKNEYSFALKSENASGIRAMLDIAKNMRPISTTAEEWDQHNYLIGVENGVINLKTGYLTKGSPTDLITKHTKAGLEDIACPTWRAFLNDVFLGDETLINFVQKAVGYSITGDMSEQCFFLCHGDGGNGKSTFLETLKQTLGDYAKSTPFSTFELKSKSQIPNDVADLVGSRFVTSSESNELDRLNEARIKGMTGSETMSARHLFKDLFSFTPTFKVWFSVNQLPKIYDSSEGMWRRVRLIPFKANFRAANKCDTHMLDKLIAERDGILKWAVEGCLKWQTEGLKVPQSIQAATQIYRETNDPLTEFITDRCVMEKDAQISVGLLWQEYEQWCSDAAEKPISRFDFNKQMLSRGCLQARSKTTERTRLWTGIRLLSPNEINELDTLDKLDSKNGNFSINKPI